MNCAIEGCSGRRYCRGWCTRHYQRWQKHGSPTWEPPTAEARFWSKVDKSGSCWNWLAGMNGYGYGQFYTGERYMGAHRYAYELVHGPIQDDRQVDHLCFNHACVNPEHLRLVTIKQNAENRVGPQSNSTSGIRGVTWNRQTQKWLAQVGHHGRNIHVGEYTSLSDAEAAVVAKRNELFTHNHLDQAV